MIISQSHVVLSNMSNNLQIAFSFLAFMLIFQLVKIILRVMGNWEESLHNTIAIRIVSTVHAILVTAGALFVLANDEQLHQNKLIYKTLEISFVLNVVNGYFLSDFLVMTIYRECFDFQFIIHHSVSFSAFFACSNHGVFPFLALFRLTSEASTTFINIRWFLLQFKMKESSYYIYNAWCLMIFFFMFRIIPLVPLWHSFAVAYLYDPKWGSISLFHKFLCVFTSIPLDFMNLLWFRKIVLIALRFKKTGKTD